MRRALAELFIERVESVSRGPKLVAVAAADPVAVVDATRDPEGVRRLVAQLGAAGGRAYELVDRDKTIAGDCGAAVLVVDESCSESYRALLREEVASPGRCVVIADGSAHPDADAIAVVLAPPRRFGLRRGRGSVDSSAARIRERLGGDAGQSAIVLVGAVMLAFCGAALFAQFGGAFVARGREQRASDLAATAAAARMGKDFARVLVPAVLPGGAPNPLHLSGAQYRARARAAALASAKTNGVSTRYTRVSLARGPLPAAVTVSVRRPHDVMFAGERRAVSVEARSTAELRFSFNAMPAPLSGRGSGGGYEGPLAYRQGKAMRPDVAAAFDDMVAAARAAGHQLTINSAFRSDAEQARLFAAHPDPKWVAPPGTSLHRYATELDLGPPGAYSWLAANARRFGFIRRYAWEPWHYGFGVNPRDVPAQYEHGSHEIDGGSHAGAGGLPDWVPQRYRPVIAAAAQRHNVQPVLLAAQLRAESGFNLNAVSPAGAQGIAQFMPGTARSVGLSDPFNPRAAINAQAKLMGGLIRQFKSIPQALAAYNAGPGAVRRHRGIPPFGETQSYVARILGLIKDAGAMLDDPAFAGIGMSPSVALVK